MQNEYQTNHKFVLALKIRPSMVLKKEKYLKQLYNKMVEENWGICSCNIDESEKFSKNLKLCCYFWLQKVSSRTEKCFSSFLCNQSEATTSGVIRTTVAVEGWHFGKRSYFYDSQPSTWKRIAKKCFPWKT